MWTSDQRTSVALGALVMVLCGTVVAVSAAELRRDGNLDLIFWVLLVAGVVGVGAGLEMIYQALHGEGQ